MSTEVDARLAQVRWSVLELLWVLTKDKRFLEMNDDKEGWAKNMCEMLDTVENRGIEIGEKRGEKRGKRRGIELAKLEDIRKIMVGLSYTAEQAMDLLMIPVVDRERYMKKLSR